MNKKLMAVAVAGALAAPGVAFAQASSVTISGIFKVGVESLSYGNAVTTRLNKSQTRVVDNSSRILFNAVEGLGNGMDAIAQLDIRFSPDAAGFNSGGNTFVGLRSKTWGQLTLGRWDLHYGKQPDDIASKAGALQATAVSLMDYIGPNAIANATRTANVVRYDMPNWNGFNATVAWSANANGASEADITNPVAAGSNSRKGDAWNINPSYTNGPWQVGYSYWRSKPDLPAVIGATPNNVLAGNTVDQRGDVVYGYYKFGGFKVGAAWNRSKLEAAVGGALVAEREAWTIPVSYVWGPHNVYAHYTVAKDIKDAAGTDSDTGARMISLAYVYDLSKRTSVGLTYSQIRNEAGINYNHFTSAALGSADAVTTNGEDPRLIQATIRHAF
jgi:predicted porin